MECQVNKYYRTYKVPPGPKTCGACDSTYDRCSPPDYGPLDSAPTCCPEGWEYTGNVDPTLPTDTGCSECSYAGIWPGKKFYCVPKEPTMTETSIINCCSGLNMPNGDPNGYCASNWCPSSLNCNSYMQSFCAGDRLNSDVCKKFCRENPGKCDLGLRAYCGQSNNFTKGICGCALPASQYPLSKFSTPEAPSIPTSCDYRCGVNPDAVRLQGQQDCKIGTICVQNINDVRVAENAIGGNTSINISQNCGGSNPPQPHPNPEPTPSPQPKPSIKKSWIIMAIGIVVFLLIVGLIILIVSGSSSSSSIKSSIPPPKISLPKSGIIKL